MMTRQAYLYPITQSIVYMVDTPRYHKLNSEWKFRGYDKMLLICLGMGESTTSNRPLNGRIVLVACRFSSSNRRAVRTKLIRRFITKHPVYAITELDETYFPENQTHFSRLVYSWGNTLSVISFEPRAEEDGHR